MGSGARLMTGLAISRAPNRGCWRRAKCW